MNRRAIAISILILAGLVVLTAAFLHKGDRALVDFKVFYQAGERFIGGEELYRAADGHYQFKYLPVSAAFFAPLALLPYQAARFIWMLIVAGSLVGIVAVSSRLLPPGGAPGKWVVGLTLLVMLKYYLRELELGQTNAVFGLLLLVALGCLRSRRWRTAGMLFGLAVALKPYALIFLPYLVLKRMPRVWLTSLAVVAGALLFPMLRYGPEAGLALLGSWAHSLSGSTPLLLTNPDNVSLFGAFAKWFGPDPARTSLLAPGLAAILGLIFLWAMWRPGAAETSDGTAWAATFIEGATLMVMIPLLSPQGWDYVFLTATPGIMLLAGRLRSFTGWTQIALVAALAIIGFSFYDLLGRALYRAFMDASILTVCFAIVVLFLISLRARLQIS